MINQEFYSWRAIYQNGEIYYRSGIKLKELRAPFRFELLPLVNYLKEFYVDIEEGEDLIYFRRVKGCFSTNSKINRIDWIRYCIGKKVSNHTSALWIDAETGELQIQQGENIKL